MLYVCFYVYALFLNMWSQKQIENLIELYKANPCLYVPKHSLYKNRNARVKALEEIKAELYKLGVDVSVAEIKAKFNNLRTNFLQQHRRYLSSIKSGAGSDDIDKPTLWYYEKILFVAEHCIPRCSQDSLSALTILPANENATMDYVQENEIHLISSQNQEEEIENFQNYDYCISPSTSQNLPTPSLRDSTPSGGDIIRKSLKKRNKPDDEGIENENFHDYCISPSASQNVPTPSLRDNATSGGDIIRKRLKKRNKPDDEGIFLNKAADVLSSLTNALANEEQPKPVETLPAKSNLKIFAEFVESQLEFLVSDEETLLETQEKITNIIWDARKKILKNKNS
ncbi:uncharacterized protein [Diabrotica undecimpunctata]|uniref:uncharacterized protein n=1 Tax=Diabrotica undecimpunctata TaxID=50387 RepID=UPI003B63551D